MTYNVFGGMLNLTQSGYSDIVTRIAAGALYEN